MTGSRFTLSVKEKKSFDLKTIEKLQNKVVQVGFLDGKSADYPDGEKVAEIAIKLEYGYLSDGIKLQEKADKKGLKINVPKPFEVPARPFMKTSWHANSGKYQSRIKNYISKVGKEKISSTTFLNSLGAEVQKDIRDSITNRVWDPNAWFTIAIKESSSPLIDTGHLRQSVTWRVSDAKD